jgi:hypothetical protein
MTPLSTPYHSVSTSKHPPGLSSLKSPHGQLRERQAHPASSCQYAVPTRPPLSVRAGCGLRHEPPVLQQEFSVVFVCFFTSVQVEMARACDTCRQDNRDGKQLQFERPWLASIGTVVSLSSKLPYTGTTNKPPRQLAGQPASLHTHTHLLQVVVVVHTYSTCVQGGCSHHETNSFLLTIPSWSRSSVRRASSNSPLFIAIAYIQCDVSIS